MSLDNAALRLSMAKDCAPSFAGAPETNEYIAKHYNVRLFDAIHCFGRMADMERRMNSAIKNEKAADKNRINAEETDERFMRGLNGENLKQRNTET